MRKSAKNKGLVFVGLSGGVDSSVSAALLVEQGFDVVGVFIKVWQPDFIECTWRDERRDAMRVAAHLHIPFFTFDLQDEYKKGVADYMIREYTAGRTPNPDVMCNKEVKFGAFFKKARSMGADYVATGHYAQSDFDKRTGSFVMRMGKDAEKDQSYFLWTLGQEQLGHTLFPVGHLQKSSVRKEAKRFGLPTEQKKDSQGVCFLGKLDMKDFLKHYIKEKKGVVLNEQGETIGTHDGAVFYTLGERHGFTVTKKGVQDGPHYITAKDLKKNTLTVSNKSVPKEKSMAEEIILEEAHWTDGSGPKLGKKLHARLRYRQALEPCKIISAKGSQITVQFEHPQPTASSGQSCVFYDKDICLGGGIIA